MKQIVTFAILFIIIVFSAKGALQIDPDFGWHLRTGDLILSSGFPYTDPFSYTMTQFRYVDHAWISSILFSVLYPLIGVSGLSSLLAVITVISIMLPFFRRELWSDYKIVSKKSNHSLLIFTSPILYLSLAVFIGFFFVRAQVFSWFMWSLFLNITLFRSSNNRYMIFLPLIFLIWSNFHGAFAAGIISLIILFGIRLLKHELSVKELIILIVSILVTLITPYGINQWGEVGMTVSSFLLRNNINEWRSILFAPDISVYLGLGFTLPIVWHYRKRYKIEEFLLYLFFLIQAIVSLKNVPFFVLLSVPFMIKGLGFFQKDVENISHAKERLMIMYRILTIVFLSIFTIQTLLSIRSSYFGREGIFYPKDAVHFLKSNQVEGEIFAEYGWGGYLIWKLPEKRVFIDGRMAIWHTPNPEGSDLPNAFDSYLKIVKGEIDYQDIFDRYNIHVVLWPKTQTNSDIFTNIQNKVNRLLTTLQIKKDDYSFLETLENDGWIKIYEDNVSIIYKKPL